jgi:hypothetical protein
MALTHSGRWDSLGGGFEEISGVRFPLAGWVAVQEAVKALGSAGRLVEAVQIEDSGTKGAHLALLGIGGGGSNAVERADRRGKASLLLEGARNSE